MKKFITHYALAFLLVFCTTISGFSQGRISGVVTDETTEEPLPGVSIIVKGTTVGTTTDLDGKYSLAVPDNASTLVYSYIGYETLEVGVNNRTKIDIQLATSTETLNEVVVIGYGVQQKSDITGSVASVPEERLEMVPNRNIAQALQGSIPGVISRSSSGGAESNQSLMIRGRNSIKASNNPLIVLDGVPYAGNLVDININDVQSIEVLKDASAAAIYGSRGSNGVILITTKRGDKGKPTISYDGKYSTQNYVAVPDLMTGEEFYNFKVEREPGSVTQSEQEVYDAGEWVDWYDLALRQGVSQEHNVSISGGTENTTYYIGGGFLDVKGLAINDDYQRITGRFNFNTKITDWLTFGTRTQYSFNDRSGIPPNWSDLYYANPLTKPYDEEGNLTIYPWEEAASRNPLQNILRDYVSEENQLISNSFINIDFPFIPGLSYRLNTGITKRHYYSNNYMGRNTTEGFASRGQAYQNSTRYDNKVIENILSYDKRFNKHHLTATGVFSYEKNTRRQETLEARGFPHDFMSWYAADQAELVVPGYAHSETNLMSQMLRLNYAYDSRYLVTLTGRRDGYSGFGANTKWGNFPSVAIGWNVSKEEFFPLKDVFNELKLRVSSGLNGNQAVGAYETISRLRESNIVSLEGTTLPGYRPSRLGMDNLGWESSRTLNVGLDFGLFEDRISGDVNLYKTSTTDLLLDRSISPIHGITSITQNIGETENKGIEVAIVTNNITKKDFSWNTSLNFSYNKNKIISLYGELDEEGNEIDDIGNRWFIGEPINVNFGYVWDGVWQLDEAEEAKEWGSQPGYVKIKDINNDGEINQDDRQIIGQTDPKFLWGMSHTFSYKNFRLNIFLHGVHGHTRSNSFMNDGEVWPEVMRNTIKKNWWTPDNPTNDWYMNDVLAGYMDGASVTVYEKADFIRVKDISLSYDFSPELIQNIHMSKLRVYIVGRNLFTITDFTGLDPELGTQRAVPLQKEYVLGVNFSF